MKILHPEELNQLSGISLAELLSMHQDTLYILVDCCQIATHFNLHPCICLHNVFHQCNEEMTGIRGDSFKGCRKSGHIK